MPNPRNVTETVAFKFSDNEILQRVAERLDDGSMAFKVDLIGGLSLNVGDINIGGVNILNASDVEINPATEETLAAVLAEQVGGSAVAYDEQAVVGGGTAVVATYTVPSGKTFLLKKVLASGENIAVYTVKVNGSEIAKKRTWFTDYNADFDLVDVALIADDVVELEVNNFRIPPGDFNGTIIGKLS